MSSKAIWVVAAVLSLVAGPSSQRSVKLRNDPVAIPRVWIVDEDGPADFVVLQDAIDAASSGDVIRVRTDWPVNPLYGGNTLAVVDGKGLFIVGEGSSRPRVAHRLVVRNLTQDMSVTIRNARLGYSFADGLLSSISPPTILLEDNEGPIWIEDCSVEFSEGFGALVVLLPSQTHGIHATRSERLAVVRSDVTARTMSRAYPPNPPNRSGLKLTGSCAHSYECSFQGMRGTSSGGIPTIGGDGGIVEDSFLFAAGSTFLGGAAGYSVPAGDGISVEKGSDVQALECVFVGGQGYGGPFIPPGIPGQPIDGTVNQLVGVARSYRIAPPISTDGSATLTATGPAGETVVSIVGTEPTGVYVPLHLGSLLVDPPFTVQVEGTIPANGALVQRISLPLPARGQAFATQYRQGLFFDSGGGAFLGSGSAVLILP